MNWRDGEFTAKTANGFLTADNADKRGQGNLKMPTLPRRGRFQIYLSTAIVLMFVAGVLMWANVSNYRLVINDRLIQLNDLRINTISVPENEYLKYIRSRSWSTLIERDFGWPLYAIKRKGLAGPVASGESEQFDVFVYDPEFNTTALILNVLSALLIIVVVASTCEWLIRRRSTQNQNPIH